MNAITITNILKLACLLAATAICVGSIFYFIKNKTVWRWIKLSYAVTAGIYALILLATFFGWVLSRDLQLVVQLTILATWGAGLVVSYVKLDAALFIDKKKPKG